MWLKLKFHIVNYIRGLVNCNIPCLRKLLFYVYTYGGAKAFNYSIFKPSVVDKIHEY